MLDRIVTLGLIQMSMEEKADANLENALTMIAEAASKGAKIVTLPELFLGPYFCARKGDQSAFERAESIPGNTTEKLGEAAKKHGIVLVGGSIFEKAANGKFYNTAPVFDNDGSLLGIYRKTHIPEDILYHEQHYFSYGEEGFKVFETAFGKVAVLICYDQWYPEAARIAALQGAEIILYPTAIGLIDTTIEENITGDWEGMWKAAQVGHAAVNNVFVAAVNRVGKEGAINFWGGSFVADPSGTVIANAGNREGVFLARCDLARVKPLQEAWRFFPNRRPDLYGKLINEH